MMASVMIKSGEGVPYFNSDKYQVGTSLDRTSVI